MWIEKKDRLTETDILYQLLMRFRLDLLVIAVMRV